MTASNAGPVPAKFNDAIVTGNLDDLTELLKEPTSIAVGKTSKDMRWKNVNATVKDFINLITTHSVGTKDGLSFLQGALVDDKKGTQRIIKNVKSLDFLVLDLDTGQSIDEVREKIIEAGLFAVIYSTHSHQGTVTEISKDDIIKKMKLDEDEELALTHVRYYLKTFKRFDDKIVKSITSFTEDHVVGGIKIFATHAPMPKYRIVLMLSETFVVSKVARTQTEAADIWKKKYVGTAQMLGAAYDKSCTDPSRLFYFPRHGKDKEFSIELITGQTLDLMSQKDGDLQAGVLGANAFVDAGKGAEDDNLQNKWVKNWWYQNRERFLAADFAESVAPVRIRKSNDKLSIKCPNDDSHSNAGDSDDAGFYCVNADEDGNEKPAYMGCVHDSCINQFGDHAHSSYPYLDLLVSEYDITEDDLDEYLLEYEGTSVGPQGVKEAIAKANGETVAAEPTKELVDISDDEYADLTIYEQFVYDIERLDKDERKKDKLLKEMVKATRAKERSSRLDPAYIDDLTMRLSKHFGFGKNVMMKSYTRIKGEVLTEQAEEGAEGRVWINIKDDFSVQVKTTARGLVENNDPARLFKLEDGQTVVRVNYVPMAGNASRSILDRSKMFAELTDMVTFYKIEGEDKRRTDVACPPDVVQYFQGVESAKLPLPVLARLVKHPIFASDGHYHARNGYDLTTSAFLDLTFKPIALPKKVTEQDLDDAWDILFAKPDQTDVNEEACGLFGEFPFHDEEDGTGGASRINWLACMLTPFVRDMINGPTPMHLIDKPTAGSGSSLMATLMSRIILGDPVPMYQYKNNPEEFEKTLISKLLKTSDGIMYYDNVNCKVDNGTLASAITAGNFSGRILGGSNEITLPVRHTWLISGNNVSFSNEMTRRLIPTNLDAQQINPEERRGFRIQFPERWAIDHREDLIWALCVFVENWVQKGMKHGKKSLGSFEEWAGVMSGIFEAAAIGTPYWDEDLGEEIVPKGFLDNIGAYKAAANVDGDIDTDFVNAALDEIGEKPFTAAELFDLMWEDDENGFEVAIPMQGNSKGAKKLWFSKYLRKIKGRVNMVGIEQNGVKTYATLVSAGVSRTKTQQYKIEKVTK